MALTDPEQQKARALKMLEAKILDGLTTPEIAKKFGVSENTVYKAMSLARKAEIVVKFEDRLYEELLPLAHSAVMGALQDGNAKIGLAVLQGTQVLRPSAARTQNQMAEDDELARYINQKRARAALEENTIDGTIAETNQAALPPSPPSADEAPAPGSAGSEEAEPTTAPSAGETGFTRAKTYLEGS